LLRYELANIVAFIQALLCSKILIQIIIFFEQLNQLWCDWWNLETPPIASIVHLRSWFTWTYSKKNWENFWRL